MVNRQLCWHEKSDKWFVAERAGGAFVRAAEMELKRPLRHSAVRFALSSGFTANAGVLAAILGAPGDYTPVWGNTAGAILPLPNVAIPMLQDDHSALDSTYA